MKDKKIRRSAELIHDEMMEWIQHNIFARIGQEWDYRGKDFDPLIHMLVGAFASEMKIFNEAINDSDRRVLKQLAQMLLPESKHLPAPAHTLIKVSPAAGTCTVNEYLQLHCDIQNKRAYFTPVFEQNLAKLNLKVVASDLGVYNYNDGVLYDVFSGHRNAIVSGTLSHLLLGFELTDSIQTIKNTSFYFNLKTNETSRLPFIDSVSRGVWFQNNIGINIKQGFNSDENIEDLLDSSKALQTRIEAIYKKSFATILDDKKIVPLSMLPIDVIEQWKKSRNLNFSTNWAKLIQQDKSLENSNLVWFEIDLAYTVTVEDFFNNFCCSTQVFPAVNRKLEIKDDGETYFDTPALNVIQIETPDPILMVSKVVDKYSGKSFVYKPLAYLKGEVDASFSIRYGGVGRLDSYNVWKRCLYLLQIFREEHQMKEVIERIGSNLSLEELHILLGEKINNDDYKRSQGVKLLADDEERFQNYMYIFMHPGITARGLSAFVEYWTTLGDFANDIPSKQPLESEKAISGLLKEERTNIYGRLVTPSTGGKRISNDTELFHALKDAVMRKERLVTPNDIINYCKSKVQNNVRKVSLKHGVDVDTRPGFGITRTIEVYLEVLDVEAMGWAEVCQELENSLNENSLSNIPFKVKILMPEAV
jgi:hypothetical protein